MKKNILFAILGIGIIGVCFSLVMFRGGDTTVIEEPAVTIEQVQEEVVVDINDKQPDTELDIEVEEVVENEVISDGVSEEQASSIVEAETPAESIVETTEPIEEAPAVEEPASEEAPVEAPAQEPVQEPAKPTESTEVQPVVQPEAVRSDIQANTIANLDAIFGGSNNVQAPPSTNNTVISNHVWE